MEVKIRIEDDPSKLYNFEDVKTKVVNIGELFFFRTSDKIVPVDGRYYRKTSPLIVKDFEGNYILRVRSLALGDGRIVGGSRVVTLTNGKVALKEETISIYGRFYLKNDPEIIKTHFGKEFNLKSNCHILSDRFYPKNTFEVKGSTKTTYDGSIIYNGDVVNIVTVEGEAFAHRSESLVRVIKIKKFSADEMSENSMQSVAALSNTFIKKNGVLYASDEKTINEYIEYKKNIDFHNSKKRKAECDGSYADKGDDENVAKIISLNRFNTFDYRQKPVAPLSYRGTFGKKYSFGVEFETAAGVVPKEKGESLSLACMSDGSISGGEYVTPILAGCDGVKSLKNISDTLAENCYVDNRCGLHIHIGGATLRSRFNKFSASKTEFPIFNKNFAMMIMKLGAMIEDDMFSIVPKTRRPSGEQGRYCNSIKEFAGVKKDTVKSHLSKYVFGGGDLDRSNNKKRQLGGHPGTRYKWVNLVNAYSDSNINTIEFRLFAGSTNYKKVYNYVLICMAIVWFAENRQGKIMKGGVKLPDVITEAYGKRSDDILRFIEDRKRKFK